MCTRFSSVAGFLLLAIAILPFITGCPDDKVAVPDVVGMTLSSAEAAIANKGLNVGNKTEAYSPTVPKGNVISQSPAAGTEVTSGAAVDLVVSKGPQLISVPNVVGKTESKAETAIVNAGLSVGNKTRVYSNSVPMGRVISQNPVAGSEAAPGTAVNLVISMGPQTVTVPNVVGMTQAAAQTAVTETGLLFVLSEEPDEKVPVGTILGQTPTGDTTADYGSVVVLTVSTGAQLIASFFALPSSPW